MPRIPTYEGPQVRSEALRPVYQRAPDLMSGARQTAQALAAGAEMLDRRIERDAQDEAFKLELQVRTDYQRQRAALREQYKGDQADQYSAAMADWWKKAPETYGQNASPMAKQIANRALGQLMLQAEADTLGFVEGEKRRSREINYRALQDTVIADAGRLVNAANASALGAQTTKRLLDDAIAYATREGGNADTGKALAAPLIAKYHADVAVALLAKPGGAKAAQDYLREFGSAIPLDVRTRVDQSVTAAVDEEEGQRLARSWATLPYTERLANAAKIENSAQRKAATDTIERDQQMIDKVRTEQASRVYNTLRLGVLQGGTVPAAQMAALAALDPKSAADLQSVINAQRKAAEQDAKGARVTDYALFQKLTEDIGRGQRVDVAMYKDRLTDDSMEKLINLQTKRSTPEVATSEQQMGAFVAAQDGWNERQKGLFRSAAYDQFNAVAQRTGKEPTYDERAKIMRDLLREVVTSKGVWFDSRDPAFRAPEAIRNREMGATVDAVVANRQFQVGQTYTDGNGNQARYLGDGKWQEIPKPVPTTPGVWSRPSLTAGPNAPAAAAPVPAPAPARAPALAPAVAPAPAAPAPAPAAVRAPAPAVPAPAPAPAVPAPTAPAPAPVPSARAPAPAPEPDRTSQALNDAAAAALARRQAQAPAPARAPAPAPARAPAPAAPRLSAADRQRIEREVRTLEADIRAINDDMAEERRKAKPNERDIQVMQQDAQERQRQLIDLRRQLNPQQR